MKAPLVVINPAIDILFLVCLSNTILYLLVFPYAQKKERPLDIIAIFSAILSLGTLLVISINYYGSGYAIDLFGFSLGWFWFAVLSHMILDTILSIIYLPSIKKDISL